MKKRKSPFIVRFAILTVVTTIAWVGFDVYRSFTTKPEPDIPKEILSPIDPTLDSEVLDKVTKKVYLEEAQQ